MANITKAQIKRRLAKLVEQLECIKIDLEELQSNTQDECDEIEPYEGKNELTPQQEERQEWLQDTSDVLDNQTQTIYEVIDELDSIINS